MYNNILYADGQSEVHDDLQDDHDDDMIMTREMNGE